MAKFNVTDSDGNQNFIEAEEAYVTENYASYEEVIEAPHVPDQTLEAREWRDKELKDTDWIVAVTDHPQLAAYKTYRQELRDWPSTDDDGNYINGFPDTRPTLGS